MTLPTEGAHAARRKQPPPPIPLTVITGFLGAGKTTLLNRLLRDTALRDTAVLINEVGEVGLDHLLVEHVSDTVTLLAGGCLCCTVRSDLIDALEKLLRDRDNGRASFGRVVIETTGLADPAPVLHAIMAHPYLVLRYRLDGVVALVDAVNGAATLDRFPEAVRQVAIADRLVLTKSDLLDAASEHGSAPLRARLGRLNPAAPILDAAAGEAVAARLLDCGLYDPERKTPDIRGWLREEAYAQAGSPSPREVCADNPPRRQAPGAQAQEFVHDHAGHRHEESVRSFVLTSERRFSGGSLEMFLELLRSMYGANLLRMKGIVGLTDSPEQPLVVHAVQHVLHPPARLPNWPDADRRTRLVFITQDIDEGRVRALFEALLNAPRPDQPDRAGLLDNPLVPFGGIDR